MKEEDIRLLKDTTPKGEFTIDHYKKILGIESYKLMKGLFGN